MEKGYTYYAFISYKHEDQKWTRWLKRKLQGYRLPVKTRKAHQDLPKRLIPIFYDSNLRPGILDAQVRSEVESSKYLIVVCSREAQKNPKWINKEINFFLENGGDRSRIIPVIVDKAEHPVKETFPSRLAELNEEETILGVNIPVDGKRTAILKIISAMQGIRIEELESEDTKRRQKNRLLASVCSLIIIAGTVFGVMKYLDVSRAWAAEEADKLIQMSNNAMSIDRKEAVQYALDALNKHPGESGKLKAELTLADAMSIYSNNVFVPAGKVETDDFIYSILLTDDGSVVLADHGFGVTAFSTEKKEELWKTKDIIIGIFDGKLYLSREEQIVEADPQTGEVIRTVTDKQEREDLLFMSNSEAVLSPNHQRKIIYGGKQFLIQGKTGETRIFCASDHFAAAFTDNRHILYTDQSGIMLYDLETEEIKALRVFENAEDLFRNPVSILTGKEKSLCILNGKVYCVYHKEGNEFTVSYEISHGQKNGVVAAYWMDEEEKTAMWIGYDGGTTVAGDANFSCTASAREAMDRHWTAAGTNTDKPNWLVLKPVNDVFTLYMYRKAVNADAFLAAECIPEGFQYEMIHNGEYIFRTNTYDIYSVWFDLVRAGNGEIVWTDREEKPSIFIDSASYDYGLQGISQDLNTIYSYLYGTICMSDYTVTSLDDILPSEKTKAAETCVLPSDGTRPTIHARLFCPADAPPEVVVYEELKEVWRTEIPVGTFRGEAPWDSLTYNFSSRCGKNGWFLLYCNKEDIHLPVLIDVIGHRTTVCDEINGYFDWWNQFSFGSTRENPLAVMVLDKTIRLVDCTDGRVIRSFKQPSDEEVFAYPVMQDQFLMVHAIYTNTLFFLNAETGEQVFRYKSTIEPFNGLDLVYAEDDRFFYFVLNERLERNIQDGYRLDTKTWTIDRRFPMADTFVPQLNRVICMDDTEVNRYSYPIYSREELIEKAREYLKNEE